MSIPAWKPRMTPARLSFLAIYNPSLGPSEESFADQIVFHYARTDKKSHTRDRQVSNTTSAEDARLRQIGLAQGMVGFAKSFSDGRPVTSIETAKSRIVLDELEPGWWILASIDLTRLPASSKTDEIDYSSRELAPPALLLQQLKTAHRIFVLHHGPSLSDLLDKLDRERFCGVLERFWTRFCRDWEVLLHGNPAVDIFGGLKLAAGGELGVGDAEKAWGSAEREALEELTRQTDGLVDVVVSRFGEAHVENNHSDLPWMGVGSCPEAHDGVIFGGNGALSRTSLRDISLWVQQLYARGENAYGVTDSPQRPRRKRPRRNPTSSSAVPNVERPPAQTTASMSSTETARPPRPPEDVRTVIPPPIVRAAEESLQKATADVDSGRNTDQTSRFALSSFGSSEKWVKYLTLGLGKTRPEPKREDTLQDRKGSDSDSPVSLQVVSPQPDQDIDELVASRQRRENQGHFLIGFTGDLDTDSTPDTTDENGERIVLRTLQVQCDDPHVECRPYRRVRVLAYVRRPFIYIFLFEQRTDVLLVSKFYRDLHRHLSPLHQPLLFNTSVEQVSRRIAESQADEPPGRRPVFDLVYDPLTLTIHTSIPNIPPSGTTAAEGISGTTNTGRTSPPPWTRIEGVNVHTQILSTLETTKQNMELERTSKTSRDWWVVWLRVPPSTIRVSSQDELEEHQPHAAYDTRDCRIAFLVRKASDWSPSAIRASAGSRLASGAASIMSGTSRRGDGEPAVRGSGPIAQSGVLGGGIGVDPRKYVESLLSLNR